MGGAWLYRRLVIVRGYVNGVALGRQQMSVPLSHQTGDSSKPRIVIRVAAENFSRLETSFSILHRSPRVKMINVTYGVSFTFACKYSATLTFGLLFTKIY